MIRRFVLVRHHDPSGISGTGTIIEGATWTDGTVSIRWLGDHPSFASWPTLDDLLAVHGHHGATTVEWLDGGGDQ